MYCPESTAPHVRAPATALSTHHRELSYNLHDYRSKHYNTPLDDVLQKPLRPYLQLNDLIRFSVKQI